MYNGEIEELYTIEEVARMLKLSARTVERFCKDGRLKAFKIGRLWRIPRSSLEQFLRQGSELSANKQKLGVI